MSKEMKKGFIAIEAILSFSIALIFVFSFYHTFSSNTENYIRSAVTGLNDSAAGKHPNH